jgi:hypothetical protein
MRLKTQAVPAAASIVLLLLAAFMNLPYGFYMFLRVVVCTCATFAAAGANKFGKTSWTWIMVGVAVTFNPVLPLHMHKADWRVFNLTGAAIFVVWITAIAKTQSQERGS